MVACAQRPSHWATALASNASPVSLREFAVTRDRPLVGQFDPDCLLALGWNGETQSKRQAVVFGSDCGASSFGDERNIFTCAVFEHVADDVAGEIALAAAELECDVGRRRAAIAEGEANHVEAFGAGVGGGDFAGLGIGIDGEGKFLERETA